MHLFADVGLREAENTLEWVERLNNIRAYEISMVYVKLKVDVDLAIPVIYSLIMNIRASLDCHCLLSGMVCDKYYCC